MFGSMARSAAVLKRLSRRLGIRTEFGKIISALQSRPFSSLITGAQRLFDSKGFQMSLLVDKYETGSLSLFLSILLDPHI